MLYDIMVKATTVVFGICPVDIGGANQITEEDERVGIGHLPLLSLYPIIVV